MSADPTSVVGLDLRADLERVEAGMRDAVASGQPMVREAAGHVLGSGGKRFRPMLVLLAGRLGDDESNAPRLLDCAVAVELTHLATLYHDDVMDEAEVRRGRPSANARFDNRVAILAGDWLFAKASGIAARLGTYPSHVLADTIAAVCEGQIMESEHAGTPNQTVERYLETIKRKTAALIGASCHLGAWLAGAGDEAVEAATAYGEALGMAFQLADDVLDITGVEAESGKVPGTDLREGVWTLPVLETLAGHVSGGHALRRFLEHRRVPEALDVLSGNGSIARATAEAEAWGRRAVDALAAVSASDARDSLEQLVGFVSGRTG
ncbi:MAG: polyprenyl synthetase family protein [Actinomycetota bacterium]